MSEIEKIAQAMKAIEAQRMQLGDSVVDTTLAVFHEKLKQLNQHIPVNEAGYVEQGLRQMATILFGEIIGLNEMAETIDLDEVHEISNQLWKRIDGIIIHYGGWIDKHAGNMVMAIFEARGEVRHAEQAVRAALEFEVETRRYFTESGVGKVKIRSGISSGTVILNPVGQNKEFSIFGETVNITSRLQTATAPGEVWISHSTYLEVRGIFDIVRLDLLQVKGKEDPIQVYHVRKIRPRAIRLPSALGRTAQLVGREKELAALMNLFNQTIAQKLVTSAALVGDIGVGKTQLLHEFLHRLDLEGKPFVLFRGRADIERGHSPHSLLRDLLAFRFGVTEGDTSSEARLKLIRGIEEWLGIEVIDAVHWIGHLAGYDFSHSPYLMDPLNNPRQRRQQALLALKRYLTAVASHTPVVIVIDDLQWADQGSLDGLSSLLRAKAAGPIFILAGARPVSAQWAREWLNKCSTVIELQPLPLKESHVFANLSLRAALGMESARKPTGCLTKNFGSLISQIVGVSGGNPLFIEEAIRVLIDQEIIQMGEGTRSWSIKPGGLGKNVLPTSLEKILIRRLEKVSEDEKLVLQAASVIGPVFWEDAVRFLIEEKDEVQVKYFEKKESLRMQDISQSISALEMRGLFSRREVSAFYHSDEYVFTNDQWCALVYASLPTEKVKAYHLKTANWLEKVGDTRMGDTRSESLASQIASHYKKAGLAVQSSDWYSRAAQYALFVSSPEDAVSFFTRAYQYLPQESGSYASRIHLLKEIWDIHWWMEDLSSARASAQTLSELAIERNDLPSQASALNRIAAVQNQQGDYQGALASVQQAERLARPSSAAHEIVMALFNRGKALYGLGNADEALTAGEQALAFQQAITGRFDLDKDSFNSLEGTLQIINLLGMIHLRAGRLDEAKLQFQKFLEITREQNRRPEMTRGLICLGSIAQLESKYASAVKYFQEALMLSEELDRIDLELICLNHLASIRVEQGFLTDASENLTRVVKKLAHPDPSLLAETQRLMALIALAQNQFPEAVRYATLALEQAQLANMSERLGGVWRTIGSIAAYASQQMGQRYLRIDGKRMDAHACYAASLKVYVEIGAAGEQARTVRQWAEYEMRQGSPREGARLWQEARRIFEHLGMESEVEWMEKHPIHVVKS